MWAPVAAAVAIPVAASATAAGAVEGAVAGAGRLYVGTMSKMPQITGFLAEIVGGEAGGASLLPRLPAVGAITTVGARFIAEATDNADVAARGIKNLIGGLRQLEIPRPRLPAAVRRALGAAESWMKAPHRHHILSLNGRKGAERELVREGQDILREVGIDPVKGVENLTWAPNKGHTIGNTEALVEELRMYRGDRELIEDTLRKHGQLAKER